MAKPGDGGCVCGAVRYRVQAPPQAGLVCHCRWCQRRTGSAFAFVAYFHEADVEFLQGTMTRYEHRSDESGRWLRIEFCPVCGTPVTHTTELRPGIRGISAGTLDDPDRFGIDRHIWTRSARPWVTIPQDVDVYAQGSAGATPLRTAKK